MGSLIAAAQFVVTVTLLLLLKTVASDQVIRKIDESNEELQTDQESTSILRSKRDITLSSTDLLPQNTSVNPIMIETDIFIDDINSFRAQDMDFRIDFFLWHRWPISRQVCDIYVTKLEYNKAISTQSAEIMVPRKLMKVFWLPDTFIANAKTVATPSNIPPTKYLKIIRGDQSCVMQYTIRLAGTIACNMDFKQYPMDVQDCPLVFRSYSHGAGVLQYKWRNQNPPGINPELIMLQHHVEFTKNQTEKQMFQVIYSVLIVRCQFIRQLDYYLIQVYTPSTLIVILSWFNFWLGLDIMAGRISLSVTSLLALVTQFSAVRKDLPPIAYINGIDIWMVTCVGFVICSLLEFTFVKFIDQRNKKKEEEEKSKLEALEARKKFRRKAKLKHEISKKKSYSCVNLEKRIDLVSRVLFPLIFIMFNTIYWPLLLSRQLYL